MNDKMAKFLNRADDIVMEAAQSLTMEEHREFRKYALEHLQSFGDANWKEVREYMREFGQPLVPNSDKE